jgi:hypothetical protein
VVGARAAVEPVVPGTARQHVRVEAAVELVVAVAAVEAVHAPPERPREPPARPALRIAIAPRTSREQAGVNRNKPG